MNDSSNISFPNKLDLSIQIVMEKLGYSDIRSAINWCKKNGVIVFTQGKKHLVNKTQFLISFYKPLINKLKEQHPEKWGMLFKSFISEDFEKVIEILNPKKFKASSKRYTPKSETSKSFLSPDNLK